MVLRRHRRVAVLPLLAAFVLGTPVGAPSGHDCCASAHAAVGVSSGLPADTLAAPSVAAVGRMDHVGVRSAAPETAAWAPGLSATLAVTVLVPPPTTIAVFDAWARRGPPLVGPPAYLANDIFLL